MGVLSPFLAVRTTSDPSHCFGEGVLFSTHHENLCEELWVLAREFDTTLVIFPNECANSWYIAVFHILKYLLIYFWQTWPARWVSIIETYPNATSGRHDEFPLSCIFQCMQSFPTLIFINMYIICCKAHGAVRGITRPSSNMRSPVGLKHRPPHMMHCSTSDATRAPVGSLVWWVRGSFIISRVGIEMRYE